ncbi:MAG: SIR2 family NAD-dependent protein deacylase [Burkholderiales bacterium]
MNLATKALASVPEAAAQALQNATRIIVFSGAGMSAESGIATFRDAQTGLWANFKPEELASPAGWRADHARVWAWYEWRRALVQKAEPNTGHRAIAELARIKKVWVITQNVDDLHERAGSTGVLHLHGSLFAPRCFACAEPASLSESRLLQPVEKLAPPRCERCQGYVRPGVVWFGEDLPQGVWKQAQTLVAECDLLIAVGTSGVVYPAAGLVSSAAQRGIFVLGVNPQTSALDEVTSLNWRVSAALGLPALLSALI